MFFQTPTLNVVVIFLLLDLPGRPEVNSTPLFQSDHPEGLLLFHPSDEQLSLTLFSLPALFTSFSVPVCCHFLITSQVRKLLPENTLQCTRSLLLRRGLSIFPLSNCLEESTAADCWTASGTLYQWTFPVNTVNKP